MDCKNCHSALPEAAFFCDHCGERVPTDETLSAAPVIDELETAGSEVSASNVVSNELKLEDNSSASALVELEPKTGAKIVGVSANSVPLDRRLSGPALHALLTQANLHRLRKQWTEATDCCIAVLRSQPDNQSAHSLLGDIYRDQNKTVEAIRWYQMAVDLRPNASDEAKLRKLESEASRSMRLGQTVGNASASSTNMVRSKNAAALDAASGLNVGTTELMGLSPSRWLKGVTAAALAFIVLVLIALIWKQAARQQQSALQSSDQPPGASAAPTVPDNGQLPPHVPERHFGNSDAPSSSSTFEPQGFPPDRSGSTAPKQPSGSLPVEPTAPTPAAPDSRPNPTNTNTGLAPLTNFRVKPILPAANPGANSTLPGIADAPTIDTQPAALPLTDGLRITRVAADGAEGATVVVAVPTSISASARGRAPLLRNLYRAARTTFLSYRSLEQVTVLLQSQGSGGQITLVEGTVYRTEALAINPEKASPATLEAAVHSLRWSDSSNT